MAFGQKAGPPASAGQVRELLALLRDAGHAGFRDARGPMGFSQRQGGGKFTRDEATALISRMQADVFARTDALSPRTLPPSITERSMRGVPVEELAAELRRRGWTVTSP